MLVWSFNEDNRKSNNFSWSEKDLRSYYIDAGDYVKKVESHPFDRKSYANEMAFKIVTAGTYPHDLYRNFWRCDIEFDNGTLIKFKVSDNTHFDFFGYDYKYSNVGKDGLATFSKSYFACMDSGFKCGKGDKDYQKEYTTAHNPIVAPFYGQRLPFRVEVRWPAYVINQYVEDTLGILET